MHSASYTKVVNIERPLLIKTGTYVLHIDYDLWTCTEANINIANQINNVVKNQY